MENKIKVRNIMVINIGGVRLKQFKAKNFSFRVVVEQEEMPSMQ